MSSFRKIKDPDAVLDYKFDWSDWLETGDQLSTSEILITGPDSSLTLDSDSNDANSVLLWLSGGTLGEDYVVTNRIVTDDGRTADRSATFQIRQK